MREQMTGDPATELEEEDGLVPFGLVLTNVIGTLAYLYQFGGEPQGPPTRAALKRHKRREGDLLQRLKAPGPETARDSDGVLHYQLHLPPWKLRYEIDRYQDA